MYKVYDYSEWELYDGFSEGSGRSEKLWLQSETGEIGLFKFPKIDPVSCTTTYEHVAEHLAHQIGDIVEISTARVELGKYNNRIGSMSYLARAANEELREGVWFILGKHPNYDPITLKDNDSGEYYSIKHILDIPNSKTIKNFWIRMMVFDYLIGNRDRHQNNWAYLIPIEDIHKPTIRIRPCPLYDNGSSLCCYVTDQQISQFDGKDPQRFKSLIDSKSRSMIRIDGNSKSLPKHSDVVRHLLRYYPETIEIAGFFMDRLKPDVINAVVQQYSDDIVNSHRKDLLVRFISGKIELLRQIVLEANND